MQGPQRSSSSAIVQIIFSDEKRGYPGGRLSIKIIVYDAALFNFDGYF